MGFEEAFLPAQVRDLMGEGGGSSEGIFAKKEREQREQRALKQNQLDELAASKAITPVQWGSATSEAHRLNHARGVLISL